MCIYVHKKEEKKEMEKRKSKMKKEQKELGPIQGTLDWILVCVLFLPLLYFFHLFASLSLEWRSSLQSCTPWCRAFSLCEDAARSYLAPHFSRRYSYYGRRANIIPAARFRVKCKVLICCCALLHGNHSHLFLLCSLHIKDFFFTPQIQQVSPWLITTIFGKDPSLWQQDGADVNPLLYFSLSLLYLIC